MKQKRIYSILLCIALFVGMLSGCGGINSANTDSVELEAIYAAADERRNAILNSPTAIVKADEYVMGESYSGTAYYVSNNGSDSNNGLSPDKPFATVAPFDNIQLEYGDAIFFERGSLWRAVELPGSICGTEGITISAYGEGAKPAFYGSEENGAGGEKWELFYSDDSGKKIWKFYREMTEVSSIVLNGEEVVNRDIAYWNGENYWQITDDYANRTGELYDVKDFLQDKWCFPAINYPDVSELSPQEVFEMRLFRSWDENTGEAIFYTGPLYMRCDAGNPGELYDDIEFIEPFAFIDGMSAYQTYDNLCIKYSSMNVTSGNDGNGETCNGVVQNCEIGWMGGGVVGYVPEENEGPDRIEHNSTFFGRNGGALAINGSGYTVRNNYVHNAFQEGIALETFDDCSTMRDVVVSGNLVERATQAILLCNWDKQIRQDHIFKDITVEDNIVLESGINHFFGSDSEDKYCGAVILQGGPCANENMVVRNNIFAVSTGALVQIDIYNKEYTHIFEGNTYAQSRDGLGVLRGICMYPDTNKMLTRRNVAAYLGDETGTVTLLK